MPRPSTPFNAAGPLTQLCVRLTPAAASLAKRENDLNKARSISLAEKLQKLLMLASPYNRILLSKLAHLGPDLGMPVNFRSRLCNEHPDRFKVIDTSYGRALELVTWDSNLAKVIPFRDENKSRGLIVERPLKFKHLSLRKGLNVKRKHHEYLLKFREFPHVCPYNSNVLHLKKESMEAEKRACAVVREVLGMTVEKRTLVDHLTHLRKEFGLPNKTRGMLVRHPEMFYISLKGLRDSVFLVEGYNEKGVLVSKDEMLSIKDELMELIREGKRMRREGRRKYIFGNPSVNDVQHSGNGINNDDVNFGEYEDGLDDLFNVEDWSSEDDDEDDENAELIGWQEDGELWVSQQETLLSENQNDQSLGPW